MRYLFHLKRKLSREDVTLSILVGVGLAFLVAWKLYPHLGFGQEYNDIVVGSLTWDDYDKDREWRIFNIFITGTVVFSLSIAMFFQYLRSKELTDDFIRATRHLFCIAWLPAVFWLGAKFVISHPPSLYLYASAPLLILDFFIVIGLSRYKEKATYNNVIDIGISSILILFLSAFSILAIEIAIGEFSFEMREVFLQQLSKQQVFIGVVLAFLFIISNIYLSASLTKCKQRFHISLLLLQAIIPLLLFVYVSQYYVYKGEILTMYRSSKLAIAVILLIALSWLILFRRYKKIKKEMNENGNNSCEDVLSAAALFPLVMYVVWCTDSPAYKFSNFFYYGWGSFDHHMGEDLLPWQQIIDFGKLPYVDYAPLHGLMAILDGGLNELFYGNTAATFPLAMNLLQVISVWLIFITLFRFAGPLPAIVMTFFAGNINMDRYYFLAPAILLLCHPKLTRQGKIWLPAWIVICLFSVFYNTSIGAGILMGSLPAALYIAWRVSREDRKWFTYFLVLLISSVIMVLIVSPLRQITFGFINYVISNASTFTLSQGIGMFQDIQPLGTPQFLFLWVFFKVSWVLVALIAIVFFLRTVVAERKDIDSKYVWLVALLPVILFMVGQYALGRLHKDIGTDRSGILSYIAVVIFLPLIINGFSSVSTRSVRIIFFALIMGLTSSLYYVLPGYNLFMQKPFINKKVPEELNLISGKDIGLPRLGDMFAEPKLIKELKELRQNMAPYLRSGETFLDFTNRSALHFYLDMPVPVLYSAVHVAANTKSCYRMVQQINENPPPVVLIFPSFELDGGPTSLRGYVLYRKLVDSYIPKQIGEHSFLIRPDRIGINEQNDLENRLHILEKPFGMRNLLELPNAWGRSWHILKERFIILDQLDLKKVKVYNFEISEKGAFKPVGDDPRISFDISDKELSGKDIDHILLTYKCNGEKHQPTPVLELSWETNYENLLNGKDDLSFPGTGTRALIPIGIKPRWRFAEKIKMLHLTLRNYESCDEFYVKDISMLKLK